MVFVVQVVSFREGDRIIQNGLLGLRYNLSSSINFIVQIARDLSCTNLSNHISRDAPSLHGHNPVIESKFAFLFVHKLFDLLLLAIFCRCPSFMLDLDNVTETFVFRERTIERFKILFMHFEQFE